MHLTAEGCWPGTVRCFRPPEICHFQHHCLARSQKLLYYGLDDQTQVDLKPAGQPEQASLNQCQLIAHNWCSVHAKPMLAIRFLCNVCDTRALIGPCSHVTSR